MIESTRELLWVLEEISYNGMEAPFIVGSMGDGYYLQHWQVIPDENTGMVSEQRGRKWYVSPHSTESEVVQTALLAILTFEEHEAREKFLYKGERLFGPHIDHTQVQRRDSFAEQMNIQRVPF